MNGQKGMAGKLKGIHDTVEERRVAGNKVGLEQCSQWGQYCPLGQ